MELKVVCNCGQKFKFDVEPVNGRMPYGVNCPVCGVDGTAAANVLLAQSVPRPSVPPPLPAAPVQGNRLAPSQASHAAAPSGTPPPLPAIRPLPVNAAAKSSGEYSLGKGIGGAVLGAVIGVGLMYGLYEWADFRFPLVGVGIGILTGFGAKLLAKGTDQTLGIISAVVALTAVVGALLLLYGGEFPMIRIISALVSASMAFKIAGR